MPSAIVAPEPIAVEEGAKVLLAGGNAVDAAVTTAFVQAIVDPQMAGIGGHALVNLHIAGESSSIVIDAPTIAGSKCSAEMWKDKLVHSSRWGSDYFLHFLEGKVNDAGYSSICTPGWVKAMAAILGRYGTISWGDAIAPAIRIATEGFIVSEYLASRWKRGAISPEVCSLLDRITMNTEARRIYLKANGEPYEMGDRLRNLDYADVLNQLATDGPEDFYTGKLARRMADDLGVNGSSVTYDDFAKYVIREGMIVSGTYHDYTITSAASPHGGPTLIAILNILEGSNLVKLGHNSPEYIYELAMAMKAAFADRNLYVADPDFCEVPEEWMISKQRAEYWRDRIQNNVPISPRLSPAGSPNTTHVTTVDSVGNCVALTHTLGSSAGVITPGMGFMYNNAMINFHPLPGYRNSIAPRKRHTTGMAPTIIYKGNKPILVLGAPGATRIITSIVQVILNVLDFGMSVSDAIHAPRIDCRAGSIRTHLRIPEYVCAEVRRRHPIERTLRSHGGFGLVHAVKLDPLTGHLAGGADTGADGMALIIQ